MGNIGAQFVVCCVLDAVESNVARHNISFQRSLGHFFRQIPCHNHLIFHGTGGQFPGACIPAMEAHKCIFVCIVEFIFDTLFIHICRNGVINIQQSNRILAHAGTDKLAERTINIHFTGYRNSHSRQTAVHVTGHKTELGLECRPAFPGDSHVFSISSVLFNPV